jgi:3-(3-hydroxy-phenyl)propionate hydroxylase
MKNHQVIIAGAGPTGMMLGAELHLAGIDVAIVEPRLTAELSGARAGGRGIHTRTLEIFDMRGILDRFLAEGEKVQALGFSGVRFDISDWPTRHPYGLALLQKHTERIMAQWIDEIGVKVYRGASVEDFTQDEHGVISRVERDEVRALYLVGCDGGRSIIRKTAGIDFPGWDASTSWLIAEVRMTEKPQFGFKEDALGIHAMGPVDDRVGLVLTERAVRDSSERTLDDLKQQLVDIYGTDFGVHSPNYLSSFTDAARQAAIYRKGRVLLAGDSAHIHPPLGGMGLNTGVQDAVNLGWKLAEVIQGKSPDTLLDSYQAERHPVAARVLKNTMAHVAARRVDDRSKALSAYVTQWLRMDGPGKQMAGEMSGLDIHYDLGGEHPLVGRRMPDLDIVTGEGATRVYELLREPKWVSIDFEKDVSYKGEWDLPVIGKVPPPRSVLIRPDGYVASVT